jgi:hypothetical protein
MVLLAHTCQADMASKEMISPSLQSLHSDRELIFSDGSMYEMGLSNPDMELDYMEHQGPYTMTPVEELKPSATDCPQDTELEYPTMKQNIILNQSCDSVLDKSHNNRSQSQKSGRQHDSYIDVISSEASVLINPCSEQVDPAKLEFNDRSASVSTITRGLLSTSGFVWIPLCTPGQRSQAISLGAEYLDARYEEAQLCARHHLR